MTGTKDIDHSVLIVGAGPVGLLTALNLAQRNIQVTVLERLDALSTAPRATGYVGVCQMVFDEMGLYQKIKSAGFLAGSMCWRGLPKDDGNNGKRLGDSIAEAYLVPPGTENPPVGAASLSLPQSKLCQILFDECCASGKVAIHLGQQVRSLTEDENSVTATAETNDGKLLSYSARFLVACDGGKSTIRKLLGIELAGYTWPDRIVTTDVKLLNREHDPFSLQFIVGLGVNGLITPLEKPVLGERTLWRYTMVVESKSDEPDEDLLRPERIAQNYEKVMAGPRPLDYEVVRKAPYRVHQRLASTMRRGRCILAGDAAHLNTPAGGLGLSNGILDSDAVSQTLDYIINKGQPDTLLDYYSDDRRRIFQQIVDPISKANMLRLQTDVTTAKEDWFLRTLNRRNPKEMYGIRAMFDGWRSDMSKLVV